MSRRTETLRAAVFSDQGKRKNNEDCAAHWLDKRRGVDVLVVADGMGGHASGEVASRIAVDTGLDYLAKCNAPTGQAIEEAIMLAHREVKREADRSDASRGMGTTIVVAIADSANVTVGHIGDSRAYQFRSKSVRRLRLSIVEITLRLRSAQKGNRPC